VHAGDSSPGPGPSPPPGPDSQGDPARDASPEAPGETSLRFRVAAVFDRISDAYEATATRKAISTLLLVGFLLSLLAIELGRHGWLPAPLVDALPRRHFVAVEWTVDALLVFELVELILGLASSVAGSVAIQLEIFALILLRKSFEELKHFREPIDLEGLGPLTDLGTQGVAILNMGADALGALAVFGGLVVFRNLQRHRPITLSKSEQAHFVAGKKCIALVMLAGAVFVAVEDLILVANGVPGVHFFASVFTGLIFVDIALVLVSLRYSRRFPVVFRNFGFTVVTIFVRLAITAPPFTRAVLGLFILAFAIMVAWLYNRARGDLDPDNAPSSAAEGAGL